MCDLCRLIFGLVVDLFRSRAALEAEVLVLKQQITVLRRASQVDCHFFLTVDKIILGWAGRLLPSAHVALAIVKPDTVIRWHGAGFRLFWRWKSRCRLGRPAARRQILWLGVTAHPTAEWISNQLTAACGWEQLPRYLIRDRDACYGDIFVRRVRSLGIRDHPTSARSPWQNGYAERLIGSIRRECLDHIVVVGEEHLRHILMCYTEYYNAVRTHLSLGKDVPVRRLIQRTGRIQVSRVLGGLHHHYVRN